MCSRAALPGAQTACPGLRLLPPPRGKPSAALVVRDGLAVPAEGSHPLCQQTLRAAGLLALDCVCKRGSRLTGWAAVTPVIPPAGNGGCEGSAPIAL